MNLFRIDGGIGKHTAFTGLVKELVEKYGSIAIEAAYPEVFFNLDGVVKVYNSSAQKDPKMFYGAFDKVFAWDPYIGKMWDGKTHFVQAWAMMLSLDDKPLSERMPVLNIDISEDEKKSIDEKLGDKPFYTIQISGGQSPYDFKTPDAIPKYDNNAMRDGRNMLSMDALHRELSDTYKDYTMVQFALPNEPQLKDALQLQLNYIQWMYVFRKAEFFVGIDSMMQHFMASIEKPGAVLWDMNSSEQFGWEYEGRSDYRTVLPGGVNIDEPLADKVVSSLPKVIPSTLVE